MSMKQTFLALLILAGLAGAAFLARESETGGQKMSAAAEKFLTSLEAKQKSKATYAFDDKERTRWFFTPQQSARKATRKGLPLSEMNDKQKTLVTELLKSSAGETGEKKASVVVSLESLLNELEKKGAMVRDPSWYFVTVFGTPSKAGKWGWRFEGHHLSLNFTLDGGKIVSATPCFYGSNPALVKDGKRKGLEPLPETGTPVRDLLALLDADQKKVALSAKAFREIEEEVTKPGTGKAEKDKLSVGDPVGLAAAKLNEKQKTALLKIIEGYAARMLPEVAAVEMGEVKKAGLDKVHFAYHGDLAPGKQHGYRIQGPTFVIEYINEQADGAKNPANHIHSSWRNVKGDFGVN